MTILYSFLFCGLICLIAQIIMDNTKLTNGHLTSMFVVIGAFLGFIGVYDKIADKVGAGASLPITSFGNLLFQYSVEGYSRFGVLGLFSHMLVGVSAGITAAIIFSFILSLFAKVRD